MAQSKKNAPQQRRVTKRPARTPEERENQLISIAMDLAERRILDGSASSQEITHFLKLGTQRNALELEKLARENDLLAAKAEQIKSAKKTEELYDSALQALRSYKGTDE